MAGGLLKRQSVILCRGYVDMIVVDHIKPRRDRARIKNIGSKVSEVFDLFISTKLRG